MNYQEMNRIAGALRMSPTMSRLAELSQDMPLNPLDDDELRSALSTCIVDMVTALDHGRITFSEIEDKAMFYGLLSVAMIRVLGQVPTMQTVPIH